MKLFGEKYKKFKEMDERIKQQEEAIVKYMVEVLSKGDGFPPELYTLAFSRAIDVGYIGYNQDINSILMDRAMEEYKCKKDLIKEMEDDMEKLTAKDARAISLSKSTKVQEMVDDCLWQIKSQAEKGKFVCNIIISKSCLGLQIEVAEQLRYIGYTVQIYDSGKNRAFTIRW